MDRTFEAVERMRLAIHGDVKSLVVVVATGFTCRHERVPNLVGASYQISRGIKVPITEPTANALASRKPWKAGSQKTRSETERVEVSLG